MDGSIRKASPVHLRYIRADIAEGLLRALAGVIGLVENGTCFHAETYRGGLIWTICQDCGAKWADDEGGFNAPKAPIELIEAQEAIRAAKEAGL
jgi:hypothetical protein